ncbi:BatD family protein [Nitratifractor sp.]|uniref:BatD family protein n=1 Tax=Nitratifractor sp. TaxID=2268144 RepID=UPI0025F9BB19|nr:BatD family protein [Nitratifractor sp.]
MRWHGRSLFLTIVLSLCLGAGVRFDLDLSRTEAYLGEPVLATFTLRYDRTMKVDRVDFPVPKLRDFSVEELNASAPLRRGTQRLRLYRYLLTPLKVGSLKIPPQTIEMAYQDRENYRYISHTYRSPSRSLTVREVPGGLKLVGDYRMHMRSDANATTAGRPVHLELQIEGIGNLDFLPAYDLTIPGALVYPSEPKVTTRWLGGTKYRKRFTQRFTVVAERDIAVPPLTLRYFNLHTAIPEILRTAPLTIRVDNPALRRERWRNAAFFFAGILVGIALTLLAQILWRQRKGEGVLLHRVRKARSDRELYRLLLPYSDVGEIQPFLRILEERLYGKSTEKIDRKALYAALRRIKVDFG